VSSASTDKVTIKEHFFDYSRKRRNGYTVLLATEDFISSDGFLKVEKHLKESLNTNSITHKENRGTHTCAPVLLVA